MASWSRLGIMGVDEALGVDELLRDLSLGEDPAPLVEDPVPPVGSPISLWKVIQLVLHVVPCSISPIQPPRVETA